MDGDEIGVDCGGSCLPCQGATVESAAYGGSGNDLVMSVAYDSNGYLYLAGRTSTPTINFGSGVLTMNGGSDVFLAKFDTAGNNLWAKLIGGTGNDGDAAVSVATDSNGNVIVGGNFYATVDFGGGPVTATDTSDAFVAKYSSTGAYVWAKGFGGAGADKTHGIAVDRNNDVIITGAFQNSISFGGPTFTAVSAGITNAWDIFVAKLSGTSGDHIWSKAFGSAGTDEGVAVSADASGYVYAGGFFSGSIDFGTGTQTSAGSVDAFGMQLYPTTGQVMWVKRWGGTGDDRVTGTTWIRTNQNVAFGGQFQKSVDFGGGSVTSAGSFDGFVVSVYRTNGSYTWGHTFGGAGADQVRAIDARVSDGQLGVVGTFQGSVDFGSGTRASAGSGDVFTVSYTSAGAYRFDATYGGSGNDLALAVDVGAKSPFAAIGGDFASPSVSLGGPTFTNAGNLDGFVTRLVF